MFENAIPNSGPKLNFNWAKENCSINVRYIKSIIFFIFQRLLLFVVRSGWWVGFGCGGAKANVLQIALACVSALQLFCFCEG